MLFPISLVCERYFRLISLIFSILNLTCKKIAQAVHYSESQISRLLEEQFGLTFGELLREIRIRNACGLLKTTDYPVESIGRWAGYTSRDGFHTAFLEDKGITPADYRNRYNAFREKENIRILSSGQLYAKIIYYLHRHYAEAVTLADTSARFRYSESYLKRVLKEQGTSFPRLLEEIRIYHARKSCCWNLTRRWKESREMWDLGHRKPFTVRFENKIGRAHV